MDTTPIWQPATYRVGDARRYDIGPISLLISRHPEEWRIRYEATGEALRGLFSTESASLTDTFGPADVVERIAAHDNEELRQVRLRPIMADRYVSARPETPVTIAPGSRASMYMSMPVWLQVFRLPDVVPLLEFPSFRPTDTWIGPSTGEGPLAYASQIRGHLDPDLLNPTRMRAVTKVTFRNSGQSPMRVTRIVIPAPALQLFCVTATGRLWSNELTITKGRDGELSEVRVGSLAPPEAGNVTKVADSRTLSSANILERAFYSLWGN